MRVPRLYAGWLAEWVLKQAIAQPERVAAGTLEQGEMRQRLSLMWTVGSGRW